MKTYTVRVTAKDIENGKHNHCFECPVARAMRRATKKPLLVTTTAIEMIVRQYMKPFRLPDLVAKFIERFDAKKRVRPFTFKIKLP